MSDLQGVIFCAAYAVLLALTIVGTLWWVNPDRKPCLHRRCYISHGPGQYTCMACGTFVGEHHAMTMAYETDPPLSRYRGRQ